MASAGAHCDPEPATARAAAPDRPVSTRIVLLGNPNTGKTTVFNRLCGTRAKTSNFPGTTTSVRTGRAIVGPDVSAEVLDLPGLYQLNLDVPEAKIARDILSGTASRPDAVLLVVDACNLTRNLMLAGELLAFGVPVVVALNMVDLAQARGLTLDPAKLASHLRCPVVPVIARRGVGLEQVRAYLGLAVRRKARSSTLPADTVASPATPQELERWADAV